PWDPATPCTVTHRGPVNRRLPAPARLTPRRPGRPPKAGRDLPPSYLDGLPARQGSRIRLRHDMGAGDGEGSPDPVYDVLTQPARRARREGRQDDLVVLLDKQGIGDGPDRAQVANLTGHLGAHPLKGTQRHSQPPLSHG